MARQDVNFGFTSTGADGLAKDFRKVGDNATLAAKGARLCADELRAEERAGKTAADGLAKAERVAALLAVTEHELDAELDKTNTKLLEQFGAAELAGKGLKGAGKDAGEAGGGFSSLAGLGGIPGGGLGAAIAAGVALAPVIATVSVGLAGLGAAAISTVGPILKAGTATKEARAALASLDPAQKAAYDSLGALKTQFAGFGKALEPQVLDIFSRGLRTASGLMGDVAPVAKATGDALGVMLGQIDAEFRSRTWQDFFGFMAAQAGPDMRLLAGALLPLLDTLPKLLTTLQPIAVQMLQAAGGAARLADAAVTLNSKIQALGTKADTSGGMMGRFADAAKRALGQILPGVPAAQKLLGALGKLGSTSDTAATSTGNLRAVLHDTAPVTQLMADNLYVESVNAALANDSVTTLNTAWSTFLGMSAGLENAQLGIIGTLKTLTDQAAKAGASFRGTNDQSVALQSTFESSLIPSVENVIGSMRQAHASTHDLAAVIATDLKPAVDKGALSNTAYKNQLYDLAVQAGYTGPNKLAPLKAWFDKNATSTDAAKAAVDRYAGALAKIPGTVHTTIIAEASGTGQIAISGSGWALGQGNIRFHAAAGAFIRAGSGPTADDVPAMLSRGELVVPARMVQAGAVDHLRGLVPGFAAGGLVGLGGQADAMPGEASTIAGNLAAQAARTGVNQAMAKAHALVAAKALMSPVYRPGGGVQQWRGLVLRALGMEGLSLTLADAVLYQMQTESGGNPRAINLTDINAQHGDPSRGLMQTIGATFRAYHWPGTSQDIYDPLANIAAALNYARHNYGPGLRNAYGGIGTGHGYALGGLIPGYASGGLVGKEGAAYLRAWQDRHGGGFGAAWGPIVVQRQIDAANRALTRDTTLAHATLPPAQHRHYVGAAAWWRRHRDALVRERGILRDWRGQLSGSDRQITGWIGAAGSNRALAPSVRRWKAQRARQEREITAISRALGWSAAQQAAIAKAHPPAKPPAPTGVKATHTYGGDVADTIGTVLSAALGPFTGARAGGLVMDGGGTLQPGWQPVYNGTGRPETLTPARGGGTLQIEWVGGNGGDDLERWIRKNVRVRGGGDVQRAYGAR